MPTVPKPLTARQRARIEFTAEITEVARRQLAESGPAGLSLRAVARELGLATPSALYRYFPGRDALLTTLILDGYRAMADAADAANAELADADPATRWAAICHAVRDWALAHPHEYALVYGSPVPGYAAPPDTVEQGTRVPYLLGGLFAELAMTGEAGDGPGCDAGVPPVPADARAALRPLLDRLPQRLPPAYVVSGITAWTYLFGALSFELFGHRRDIIEDPRAYFDHEIRRVGALLGLRPASGAPSGTVDGAPSGTPDGAGEGAADR